MESLHSAGAATVETEVLDLGNMDGRDTAEKAPNPTAILETLRESLTSRAKDLFDEKIDRFRLLEDVSGDAQIVRNLGKISNNDEDLRELFELMAKDNVDSSKVKLIPYSESNHGFEGLLKVNKGREILFSIHPLKLLEIEKFYRKEKKESLFAASGVLDKPFKDETSAEKNSGQKTSKRHGTLPPDAAESRPELSKKARKFLRMKLRVGFDITREQTMKELCKLYNEDRLEEDKLRLEDISVNGLQIFANLRDHEKDRIVALLKEIDKNSQFLLVALKFAKFKGCKTFPQFVAYTEFIAAHVKKTKKEYEIQFDKMREEGSSEVEVKTHFKTEDTTPAGAQRLAIEKFSDDSEIASLSLEFEKWKEIITPLDAKLRCGGFTHIEDAVYHYIKHKDFEVVQEVGKPGGLSKEKVKKELECEKYFDLCDDVVSGRSTRTLMGQDGSCTMSEFKENRHGRSIYASTIKRFTKDGVRYSNLMTMYFEDDPTSPTESSTTP